MPSARIYCPECRDVVEAPTVQSSDITYEKYEGWSGELDISYRDLKEETGEATWRSEPTIYGFRRIRRCRNEHELLYTVEVDEALVREVIRLRALVAELKEEAARAAAAAAAIKRLLD